MPEVLNETLAALVEVLWRVEVVHVGRIDVQPKVGPKVLKVVVVRQLNEREREKREGGKGEREKKRARKSAEKGERKSKPERRSVSDGTGRRQSRKTLTSSSTVSSSAMAVSYVFAEQRRRGKKMRSRQTDKQPLPFF